MPAKKTKKPGLPTGLICNERVYDDPEQSKRFLEAAERAEASNDPKDLDRALKKIVPKGKC